MGDEGYLFDFVFEVDDLSCEAALAGCAFVEEGLFLLDAAAVCQFCGRLVLFQGLERGFWRD